MEIREQTSDPLKLVRRINKGGSSSLMRTEGRCRLKNPSGSRADGNNFVRLAGLFKESRGDFVCLGVHRVVPVIWSFDGAKRAQTHVKSDKGVGKFGEKFRGKVKSGGGSGDGADFLGVSRLVIDEVGWLEIRLAMGFAGFQDVGWQRRKTVLV